MQVGHLRHNSPVKTYLGITMIITQSFSLSLRQEEIYVSDPLKTSIHDRDLGHRF